MPKSKTLEETYDYGLAEGYLHELSAVNTEKIKSLLGNSEILESSARRLSSGLEKNAREWMGVYSLNYDALRILAEALLLSERIEAVNHQCLFAALVIKYSELELSWDFFEKIRTKRNGLDYYGSGITHKDWKEVELQMGLHISTLKKKLIKRLE